MTILDHGLSLWDKICTKFFKSKQQRLCERYAKLSPGKFELIIRRESLWWSFCGYEYSVEAWNKTKYAGHCHKSDDLKFGCGISVSDAFSDLARKILAYEKLENNDGTLGFRSLIERMDLWQKASQKTRI